MGSKLIVEVRRVREGGWVLPRFRSWGCLRIRKIMRGKQTGIALYCSHIVTTIKLLKLSREFTMSTADTYVRARIDTSTKERAADALEAMGLSISDAIRLLMLRIADERRMPFDVKAPNATTRKAIAELEAGKGKRFASVDDLMADLHADD